MFGGRLSVATLLATAGALQMPPRRVVVRGAALFAMPSHLEEAKGMISKGQVCD